MKDLIILGNGFDLSCGLSSQYSDFFNDKYSKFNKEDFMKKIKELSKIDKQIYELETQITSDEDYMNSLKNEEFMRASLELESIRVRNEENQTVLEELKNKRFADIDTFMENDDFSIWDYICMYKSDLNSDNDILWKDVEKEILNTLVNINNENFEFLLLIYINSKKFRELSEYNSVDNFLVKNNYEDIYMFLLDELNCFEESFKKYLLKLTQNKQPYENRAHELFKKIVNKDNDNNFYVINFNYTSPFSNIEKRKVCYMNSVHGDLISDEIIFGIDGFTNLPVEVDFFTKTSRTMFLNKEETQSIPKLEDTGSIYFYGHSLSEADYSYFLSIFDFYEIYSSHVKLCFVYTDYKTTAKKELVKSISSLMNKYGESFDNKAKGRNLVHKLNLENRIVIKKI